MNLRQLAAQVLNHVLKEGVSLTVALNSGLKPVAEAKNRAFIQALCYGVMRDYSSLNFIAQQMLVKPLKQKEIEINLLILIGLYQLRSMRVAPHAAVAETVAAVGKKTWAKNLVNALLRQYLRDQAVLEQQLTTDALALSNHPQWLLDAIQHDWPQQLATIIEQNQQPPPLTLRINRLRSSREQYAELLLNQGFEFTLVDNSETAIQLTQAVPVEQLPYFAQGWVSVQDAAAQLTAPLLDLQPHQRVLDLCAAPGGKSTAIFETQPLVQLTAVDSDPQRLKRLHDNVQRLGVQLKIQLGDATQARTWWDGHLFERILLDAPCSALGVIRRHPDIKWLRRAEDVPMLQQLQRQLLEAAWHLLARGGILLYATCSILQAENEQMIAAFLAEQADSFEIPITAAWGQQRSQGRQILTGEANMDGFYYARLGKH
jgi:16S rRNA (cytosine967-C5)-methyltransferase